MTQHYDAGQSSKATTTDNHSHEALSLLEAEKIYLKISVIRGLSAINEININNYLAEIDSIDTGSAEGRKSLAATIADIDKYSKYISNSRDIMGETMYSPDPNIPAPDNNLRRILERIAEMLGRG